MNEKLVDIDILWLASGVDLFFVVSAFVMATSTGPSPSATLARIHAAWISLKRRFIRIVPLHRFYNLAKPAPLLALPSLAARSDIDPGHLTASLLFALAAGPRGSVKPALPVGWTLKFEMLFCRVFAAAIALGFPAYGFAWRVCCWLSLLAAISGSGAADLFRTNHGLRVRCWHGYCARFLSDSRL